MKFSESSGKTFCKNSNVAYEKIYLKFLRYWHFKFVLRQNISGVCIFANISFNLKNVSQVTAILCLSFCYRLIDMKHAPHAHPHLSLNLLP